MTSSDNTNIFIVREYRKGDFDGINNLWALTGMGNQVRGDDENTIENSLKLGGKLFILEDNISGIIIGTSWMTFDGRRIHLHHFGILPDYQGRGYSKVLLKKSLESVKESGYQVKLEVHRNNRKAIELYEKAGFTYLGDYDIYIIRDTMKIT